MEEYISPYFKKSCSNISLDFFQNTLQIALKEGWQKFKASNHFEVYSKAFDFFKKSGLYEGLFRPQIPNPAYDNAAKEIGKLFLNKSLELGLYYKELFPGDFTSSTEETQGDLEFRLFYLTTYYKQKKIGVFKIIFEHKHDYFDFPSPPLLEICNEVN